MERTADGSQLIVAILEGIPLPAVAIGADERVAAMNAEAVGLLGAGLVGRHHAIALRQAEVQGALGRALGEKRRGVARHVIPGPSRDTVHRATVTPLPGGGALCVFEDLSAAEQIGRMRREFVANVSHELRSPLTTILGFIETLRGPARDDRAARERFLAVMESEASRMNRLIHDLLHLSRVESDERVRPTTPVALDEVVRATVALLRPQAEAAGVALVFQPGPGPWTVPGDADQLQQVLQNLIENAIKYGASGGEVTIRLAEDELPAGAAVRVEVIDRGDGIDAVHLPRLTERFYRVDGHRSREQGGTGLGLAIVKHIVQRHRGRLRIDSRKGQGSTFAAILPRQ